MDFTYRKDLFVGDRDEMIAELAMGKRVLHVGAADSPYTKQKLDAGLLLHARLADVTDDLVGIDLDSQAAEICNRAGLPRIEVIDMNEFSNEIRGDFDIIIFGETIEHLLNVGTAMETLAECMNPSTRLIVSTPNLFSFNCFRMARSGVEHVHDDHKLGFSYGLLHQLLSACGYEVESIFFTFLPRVHEGRRKRAWKGLAQVAPGFSETLLAIARLPVSTDPTE